MILRKLTQQVIKQNPELKYLENKPVYFLRLPIRRVFGVYFLLFDSIVLFGNYSDPALIFSIAHELDHMHFRHKHGIMATYYKTIFERSSLEKYAMERGIRTLKSLKLSYADTVLRWAREKNKNYMNSKNPLKRLFYEIYYKNIE